MDYLQFIFQAINNLLTQNLGFFDAMGQNLFRAFATILVVWFGVKSALSSAGGRHMLHFDNFASLLLTVSFGFAMVNYYSAPIPGDRKSTRLNSSHSQISYAVFCLKKKKKNI